MLLALPKIHCDVPHRCIATLQYDLSRCYISICLITTLRTFVPPLRQFLFACMCLTSRAGLASTIGIYLGEVCASLEANMIQDIEELPETCIQGMLA
jgi:hypothetical protein